tara:strand:+ start:465 stop:986 length:522 start_codon:yes stop_codon:yes gene_type:complete
MKSFNQFRDITETILLGRYVRLGDRKAKVLKVHSQGEARFDTLYLVRFFDDQSQTIMHDSMLRPFLESYEVGELEEEVPTTNTTGVAGIKSGDMPPVRKKKRKKFAGCEVFEVEAEEYSKFFPGPRKKYERWNRRLKMDSVDNNDIRTYANKNPGKQIIIQCKSTGMMTYLRR